MIFAPNILHFLLGDGFEGSYLPFRIIAPLIFIIGYEQILVMQILIPCKHDKVVLRNSVIGASIAILANLLIVKIYGATGSAIVWLTSELAVLTATLVYICRTTQYRMPVRSVTRYALCYLPLAVILYWYETTTKGSDLTVIVVAGVVVSLFTVLVQKYYIKSPVAIPFINRLQFRR